jgi:hypothetical protein
MSVFLRGLHIASKQVAYLLIILATALISLVGAVYWIADAVDYKSIRLQCLGRIIRLNYLVLNRFTSV